MADWEWDGMCLRVGKKGEASLSALTAPPSPMLSSKNSLPSYFIALNCFLLFLLFIFHCIHCFPFFLLCPRLWHLSSPPSPPLPFDNLNVLSCPAVMVQRGQDFKMLMCILGHENTQCMVISSPVSLFLQNNFKDDCPQWGCVAYVVGEFCAPSKATGELWCTQGLLQPSLSRWLFKNTKGITFPYGLTGKETWKNLGAHQYVNYVDGIYSWM